MVRRVMLIGAVLLTVALPTGARASGDNATGARTAASPTCCGPQIAPDPAANAVIGDMFARPGGSSSQPVSIRNVGDEDLTLTGAAFSGPDAGSFRLLTGAPTGTGDQPYAFPRTIAPGGDGETLFIVCDGAQPPGQRTATLTLTSDDAAEPSIAWPVQCLVDATPPSLVFTQSPTGRQGWFVATPADLEVRGVDPESGDRIARIYCSDTQGPALDFAGAIATFQLTGDGVHGLSCRATDVAGNTSADGAFLTDVWIDTVAPNTVKLSGPPTATHATAAQFAFTASDATSGLDATECRIDSGAYAACASPTAVPGLAEGLHRFSVRGRDVAGNVESTPATWQWRVDATPPDTTIGGGPTDPTAATAATFTVDGSDPGGSGVVGIQCSLDDAPYVTCPDPLTYTDLADGLHTLRARAVDSAQNVDPTPAARSWTIDRTAPSPLVVPALVLGGGPSPGSALPSVPDRTAPIVSRIRVVGRRLTFRLSEAATVRIVVVRRVEGRRRATTRFVVPISGHAGTNALRLSQWLRRGRYRVTITAVDAAGNRSRAWIGGVALRPPVPSARLHATAAAARYARQPPCPLMSSAPAHACASQTKP